MIAWNEEKCVGCCICTHFCPADALKSWGAIEIDPDKCNACLECISACPADALEEAN